MAAISSPSRQHHPHSRLRSASDPFVDPSPRTIQQKPPPPPPKSAKPPKMPATVPKSAPLSNPSRDITEAVRDTVTVRGQQDNGSRTKVNRTLTSAVPVQPAANSRPSGRRSHSEDSGGIVEKPRANGKPRKKGSQHADVIDRMDFTGVGPMFHHDGPFDACAPSRNKHRNKAPLYAWGDETPAAPRYGDSAYPSAQAYTAFTNDYPEPPKKKVDAIAEAWGMHEPEPFEEFFAGGGSGRPDGDTPASSIYNGKDSHTSHTSHASSRSGAAARRPKEIRETREDRPRMAARRSLVPPPQPIFVGEAPEFEVSAVTPPASPGYPKRSKSLMQRIRKMRDAPNVPVGPDYEQPPASPTSPTDPTRPTHRSQNSFLGRFGQSNRGNISQTSEPFVFIETQNTTQNKDLPAPPAMGKSETTPPGEYGPSTGYFEAQNGGVSSSPGAGGLGRKTSIMKKVGRVVRGGATK